MKRAKRSGGKFGGRHTSLIPCAHVVADLLITYPEVEKVVPGFIKMGLQNLGGNRRVKATIVAHAVRLSVRDNNSHQELHVHCTDPHTVILRLRKDIATLKGTPIVFAHE